MRRRRALAFALVAGGVATAVLACNLLNGSGSLTIGDGTEDGGPSRNDGGGDGGSMTDPDAPAPPTCVCVSAPPPDWAGPIALLENAGGARACPTGLSSTFQGGVDPAAAGCTPCTCGSPKEACSSVHLETSGNGICSAPCNSFRTVDAGCGPVKYCGASGTVTVSSALDAGSCAASGGGPKPVAWAKSAVACGFTVPFGTVCSAGEVCAPKSEGAPDARMCIVHAGDVACPAGGYAQRVVYDSQLLDTRTCSACTCDPPEGSCTAGTVSFYMDTACADNTPRSVPTTGACTTVNANAAQGSARITVAPTLIDGGCAPHGGALVDGGVKGATPSTVCCL